MAFDLTKFKASTVHERHTVWLNAKRLAAAGKKDAIAALAEIEASGLEYLPDKQSSVTLDSPVGLAIRKLILSPGGQTAALAAHEAGLPPLAGVDPLLKKELDDQYSKRNEATVQAGYIVTGMMQALGYVSTGSAQLPPGCNLQGRPTAKNHPRLENSER